MTKTITNLKVQKRNQDRLNIYLDGDFAFGLSRFVAAWLQVGQELSDEVIAELLARDAEEIAYQKSIHFIGYRVRTTAEVEKHLMNKGIEPDTIDQVVRRLEKNGLLNDKQFAEMWVDNRNEFRPRSHRLLVSELKKKGVKNEIIQSVIEKTTPEDELAYFAAQKRSTRYEHLDWQDFRKKLGSYLARRGFSYSTINPIITQIWDEKNEDK
jgi:regulatory protein